jgi:hypothetical protein
MQHFHLSMQRNGEKRIPRLVCSSVFVAYARQHFFVSNLKKMQEYFSSDIGRQWL